MHRRVLALIALVGLIPLFTTCIGVEQTVLGGENHGAGPGMGKPTAPPRKEGTIQAVELYTNGQAKGIVFVGTHKPSGEGEFLVDEYHDQTGAVYEVAQPTSQVVYFNSMRGGFIAGDDTRPSITFQDAEKIALNFAQQHVRDWDMFRKASTYQPEPQSKGNTFALQWIGSMPAKRTQTFHAEGMPAPPPPYRVLVVLNSKGDIIEFVDETY